jgi:hypothetical protein
MAKSYHLKEIIERQLNRSIRRINEADKKISRFSNEGSFLDETAIWKAALRLETAGMELFD